MAGGKDAGEDAPLLLNAWAGGGGGGSGEPAPSSSAQGNSLELVPAVESVVPAVVPAVDSSSKSQLGTQTGAQGALPRRLSTINGGLHPAANQTPWGMTAGLLLADMFGIGALALPGVFARLGWLVSFALLITFGLGCGYLGVLFSKLGVRLPNAVTMDDIGSAAMGATGKRLVYGVVYVTILVDPIALHITCVLALQQVFPGLGTLAASGIIAVVMLLLAQIQNLHDVGWLSLLATGCMISAVFATLIRLLSIPGDQLASTSLLPPPGTRAIEGLIAALNMSFAFGGQVNWMRYLSSMAHREEFRWAAELADALMTVFYVLLGVTAYSKLGVDFDHGKPITSVLPRDAWARAINAALLIRCLVAYTLNANVFTDLAMRLGRPWLSRLEDAAPFRLGRRASWGLLSFCGVTMSFLVAWAVPKFDLVIAIIAAIGDVAAPYTLPALFGLILLTDIHRWERWLLKMLVPVSALFATFGLYASGYALVESFGG